MGTSAPCVISNTTPESMTFGAKTTGVGWMVTYGTNEEGDDGEDGGNCSDASDPQPASPGGGDHDQNNEAYS